MPVIGHTFVGLATAVQWEPVPRDDGQPLRASAAVFWVPYVVVVANLPDLITQAGAIAGVKHAGLIGHSLIIALAGGAAIAALWSAAMRASPGRVFAITIGSILVHDLLDIVQATDRAPLWPWSSRTIGVGLFALPARSAAEGLLFVALFAAFLVWRWWSGGSLEALRIAGPPGVPRRSIWFARAAVLVIVAAALLTHTLRSVRERQIDRANELMADARYADALALADRADRWPWSAKPGRLDVLRGEAHEALGRPLEAERHYLRAYDEDPTNFWALADLVEFYASCAAPTDRRARLPAYLAELRRAFPHHERLEEVLARVDRRLKAKCAQSAEAPSQVS